MVRPVPFVVVIPARYASSRLPGKPLADIAGMPMVVHVAQRAAASGARAVYVATDHKGIFAACREHGLVAVMTRADHASGTERIAELAVKAGLAPSTIVVNVQGDEPAIAPALIRAVAGLLARDVDASVATACHAMRNTAEFFNPNAVKVVLDRKGRALYFSRAPIPWARDAFSAVFGRAGRSGSAPLPRTLPGALPCYRHIGIYAYRASFLARYARLKPAPLEQFEALEQLRVLWHGYRIAVAVRGDAPEPGVDTPEDLERVRAAFSKKRNKSRQEHPGGLRRLAPRKN